MKLREKIDNSFSDLSNGLALESLCDVAEIIADEHALNFVKWVQINCTDIEISDKGQIHYFYNDNVFKTPEELLIIYKSHPSNPSRLTT